MAHEYIDFAVEGPVAHLTLDRPEKRNAIVPAMADEAVEALRAVEDEVRAVCIRGAGEAFCAGMDLKERFREPREEGPKAYAEAGRSTGRFFRTIYEYRRPTVASIGGWTFGAGYCLQALCDNSVAAADATFGLSEINFGIFPGGGTMWAAVNTMDRNDALYYTSTGEPFDGATAAEIGAVREAVPADELDARTDEILASLVEKDPVAMQYNLSVLERVRYLSFAEALDYERGKSEEMKYYQGDEWVSAGIEGFEAKEYRPGLEAYDRDDEAE